MLRRGILSLVVVVLACLSSASDDKDNPLSEPKKAIEHQLKLIKDGDVEKLKACFTPRLKGQVTKEAVAAAQKQTGKVAIDDLVKDVAVKDKTAKITMKNGRTLTTLVLTDGKWLADTVWFK